MNLFEKFENEIMYKLLEGTDNVLSILKDQYEKCTVKSREFSGVGFFTTFSIDKSSQPIKNNKTFHIGDVIALINNPQDSVGFVLFIKDGYIDYLEGYTYGNEEWPLQIDKFKLSYIPNGVRDLGLLKKNWE